LWARHIRPGGAPLSAGTAAAQPSSRLHESRPQQHSPVQQPSRPAQSSDLAAHCHLVRHANAQSPRASRHTRASAQAPCRRRSWRNIFNMLLSNVAAFRKFPNIHKRQKAMQSPRWTMSRSIQMTPRNTQIMACYQVAQACTCRGHCDDKPPDCTVADERTRSRQSCFTTT
jgi:hypothetical protein